MKTESITPEQEYLDQIHALYGKAQRCERILRRLEYKPQGKEKTIKGIRSRIIQLDEEIDSVEIIREPQENGVSDG